MMRLLRNIADVTGDGKPISGVSAVCPLVAFYDIHTTHALSE
jgi:hypothetical protein